MRGARLAVVLTYGSASADGHLTSQRGEVVSVTGANIVTIIGGAFAAWTV